MKSDTFPFIGMTGMVWKNISVSDYIQVIS